jgi:hypothetical protein
MTCNKPPLQLQPGKVDWSDPHLDSLLQKTAGWQLDARGGYAPTRIKIYMGWSATLGMPGTLVWEGDGAITIETDFPMQLGEQVRVDKPVDDRMRCMWGVVKKGRPGNRPGDAAAGIHVYWLQISKG